MKFFKVLAASNDNFREIDPETKEIIDLINQSQTSLKGLFSVLFFPVKQKKLINNFIEIASKFDIEKDSKDLDKLNSFQDELLEVKNILSKHSNIKSISSKRLVAINKVKFCLLQLHNKLEEY